MEAFISKKIRKPPKSKPCLGWREWISLPLLGIAYIKAKVDTGARTSSLHASDIEKYKVGNQTWVKFKVHPIQRNNKIVVTAKARMIDERMVKSSTGHSRKRPVIETDILIGTTRWPIEITLINRDEMGFRMLIGRQAIRGRFFVDPASSFLQG